MNIVELRAENFKRLRAVQIRPDGSVVTISGKNGAGKSSILDGIWAALAGGAAAKATPRPIRDGERDAEVTVDLGKIRVTRKWSGQGGTSLVVESPEGAAYRSPQTLLDGLVGRLSFDPLAFAQQSARDQLATLLELVDLPFDVDDLADKRRQLFDRRTSVNRDVAKLRTQVDAMPEPSPDLPKEEVSTTALLERYRAAEQQHHEHNRRQRDIDDAVATVRERRRELQAAERALLSATELLESLPRPSSDPLPDLEHISGLIDGAEETNRKVRAAVQRERVAGELVDAMHAAANLTQRINDLDEDKARALRKAQMPIDGLAFDDEGVTYRGVPFKQCSSGEQLRVSVAMALAMNPDVRVILIRDGSLLDADNLAIIEEMARERDAQIWIERVSDDRSVGIVIEDGALVDEPESAAT